jgi:pimeloyl-ACP methyl ester carboxylesterase
MNYLRKHGQPPFQVVVVHGGPGAAGDVQDLAEELSKDFSVLEPFQTAKTVAGQVEELKEILVKNAQAPVILIGHSWGAILSYIFAAENPKLVKKLIMISSAVFEDKYIDQIEKTRQARITPDDRKKIDALSRTLNDRKAGNKDVIFAQFGQLIDKVDSYHPLTNQNPTIVASLAIYQGIWPEFVRLRKSGKLSWLGQKINCPVIAIHGDYDPRPAEGVQKPLSAVVKNFKFILLKNCGHYPWREKEVKDKFYKILKKVIITI